MPTQCGRIGGGVGMGFIGSGSVIHSRSARGETDHADEDDGAELGGGPEGVLRLSVAPTRAATTGCSSRRCTTSPSITSPGVRRRLGMETGTASGSVLLAQPQRRVRGVLPGSGGSEPDSLPGADVRQHCGAGPRLGGSVSTRARMLDVPRMSLIGACGVRRSA